MPVASDAAGLRLPRTFRPLGVRLAIYLFGGLLLAVAVLVWVLLPDQTQASFNGLEKATLVVIGLMFAAAGYALARSRLVARADGLVVVNGYRKRRFDWNQVLGVSLRAGSPWAVLDLSDGTSTAAMGIQGSDGPRASRQVRELRRLIDVITHPPVDN
ncbi:MAG: PH domain-containing protein [Nocardioidaceae bacterium]